MPEWAAEDGGPTRQSNQLAGGRGGEAGASRKMHADVKQSPAALLGGQAIILVESLILAQD